MKDYVCKCINCGAYLIDNNADKDAQMFELKGDELVMERMIEEDESGDDMGSWWACPKCMTDAFLIDIEEY